MINRKMAKIREKFLWTSLYIEIAWLRFKISKLAPIKNNLQGGKKGMKSLERPILSF